MKNLYKILYDLGFNQIKFNDPSKNKHIHFLLTGNDIFYFAVGIDMRDDYWEILFNEQTTVLALESDKIKIPQKDIINKLKLFIMESLSKMFYSNAHLNKFKKWESILKNNLYQTTLNMVYDDLIENEKTLPEDKLNYLLDHFISTEEYEKCNVIKLLI